jgi:hypothetical protein
MLTIVQIPPPAPVAPPPALLPSLAQCNEKLDKIIALIQSGAAGTVGITRRPSLSSPLGPPPVLARFPSLGTPTSSNASASLDTADASASATGTTLPALPSLEGVGSAPANYSKHRGIPGKTTVKKPSDPPLPPPLLVTVPRSPTTPASTLSEAASGLTKALPTHTDDAHAAAASPTREAAPAKSAPQPPWEEHVADDGNCVFVLCVYVCVCMCAHVAHLKSIGTLTS